MAVRIQSILLLFLLMASPCPPRALAGETLPGGPLRISRIMDDAVTSQGFLVLMEAYRRLGIDILGDPLPAERSLQAADGGVTDGDAARIAGLESLYPNLVRVPEPLVLVEIKAFTAGSAFSVEGWASLAPYAICYIHGIKIFEQGTMGMRRMPASSTGNVVRLLREGRCDVALLNSMSWIAIDRLNAGPLLELEPALESFPLYHYLNRRNEALVPLLADELRRMREEGVTDAILAPGREAVSQAKARQSLP